MSASRSPARPAPPTTRRTPGSSASRPKWWSASISATTSRAISAAAAPAAQLAAPIVRDFLKVALADRPAVPFRVPAGIKLIRVNPRTGMRAGPGEPSILEAFKPGTAPPDGYSVDRRHRCRRPAGWPPPAPPQQQPQQPSIFAGLFGSGDRAGCTEHADWLRQCRRCRAAAVAPASASRYIPPIEIGFNGQRHARRNSSRRR